MAKNKNWTQEEKNILCDIWGEYAIPSIAKKLNRSVTAIVLKAQRLNLGAHLLGDHRVTLNQLLKVFGRDYGYFVKRLERAKCPIQSHKVHKSSFKVIDIDKFWKWAELHKNLFDFSKLEDGILGVEPNWVKEKRKIDYEKSLMIKPHNEKWSKADDDNLERMLNKFKYGYAELAKYFSRSESAIKRRIYDLGLKARPLKRTPQMWQESETEVLANMFEKGYSYEQIGIKLERTALQVRAKHENIVPPEWQQRINERGRDERRFG